MMKTILSYAISNTNYGIANLPNMYNFILSMMDIMDAGFRVL